MADSALHTKAIQGDVMRYRAAIRCSSADGVIAVSSFELFAALTVGGERLVPANNVYFMDQEQLPVWVPASRLEHWRTLRAPEVFTCPECGATSHHPQDLAHGYCGACHEHTAAVLVD